MFLFSKQNVIKPWHRRAGLDSFPAKTQKLLSAQRAVETGDITDIAACFFSLTGGSGHGKMGFRKGLCRRVRFLYNLKKNLFGYGAWDTVVVTQEKDLLSVCAAERFSLIDTKGPKPRQTSLVQKYIKLGCPYTFGHNTNFSWTLMFLL